ncbi:ATP-binding protein [Methanosalsum zhilinae]|uniref:ATP-binding protein n=1 Tax=Methanosalsum zhilinae TaxID=39669 RepID=UPI00155A2712|nr:ATP-binding protein [Methanosalsum zhilinae]
MTSAIKLAAQARGYSKAAKDFEDKGQFVKARELYLKSSKLYNEASSINTDRTERNTQRDIAQHLFSKAQSLKSNSPNSTKVETENHNFNDQQDEESISKSDFVLKEIPKIGFDDIGGLNDVKEDIRKAMIYPFTHKELYQHYGQKAGEGILLYGPPGCGKTLMAKAAAKECDAEFINVKTSNIVSKWVGSSEKNIKQIFETARKSKKAIIFFDEIDSIAGKRSDSKDYSKRMVNELLAQMDGVEQIDSDILVLAATNEPWNIDPALRRPGRFSKLLFIPEPDHDARLAIFNIYLESRPIDPHLCLDELAANTEGYSGADISSICKEAADIPLNEALKGGLIRNIELRDFTTVILRRSPSIKSWYIGAQRSIKNSGEESIFKDILERVA